MRYSLLVGLLLLPSVTDLSADELSDFETFRSYPFLDRGYREAERDDWSEVERTMRHLLERVPHHQEARRLLVQALTEQHRHAAAELEALRLPEGNDAEALLELRLAWIAHDPPDRERIQAWLDEARAETHTRLWLAYAQALERREGTTEALTWLEGIDPAAEEAPLRRWRASLAERLGDWPGVERELTPLAGRGQLTGDDWQRLLLAHLDAGNLAIADAMLTDAPDPEHAREMRLIASQRAIAGDVHERAKQWLLELGDMQTLSDEQQASLLELARETRDLELFATLGRDTGMPCLDRAQWLANHSNARARQELADCHPEEDPKQWLALAQQLKTTDVLLSTTLQAPYETQRQALLVHLWQARGDTRRARHWLAEQPQGAFVLRQRAELAQQAGETVLAADLWERLYQLDGDPRAVDQASFLALDQDQPDRALALLEPAFDRHGASLPHSALARLASLYANPDLTWSPQRVETLLPQLAEGPRRHLLVRLANDDACDLVTSSIGDRPTQAGEWHALGVCAMPERPGEAVVHYRQAMAMGDTDSQLPLAYALHAAGDAPSAYAIWQTYTPESLDATAAMAASRSALAAGEPHQAERFWVQGEPQLGEDWQTGAEIALSLGNEEAAWHRQHRALEHDPGAQRFYAAAATARALGDKAQASAWLAEAAERAPDNPVYRLDHALLLAASEDEAQRKRALPLLEQSLAAYPEDHRLRIALAARHAETGDSSAARLQLREGIDLTQRPLQVEDETPTQLAQRRYEMRRQHEALSRRSRVSVAATTSPSAITADDRTGGSQTTTSLLWDHLLDEAQAGKGRELALYGRLQQGGSLDGDDRLGTGIGLRIKPLAEKNLNLSAELFHERSLRGDESETLTEPLLRMTASFFDQGEYRNDWRVDETRWQERSLYTDLAWWTRSGNKSALARYRHGPTYKLPTESAQTLKPYVMAQASASETEGWQHDTRAGIGLRWQRWFDEDRYNAYRGNVTLRLEYQQSLGGELHRNEDGVMAGLEINF
ncbi:NfrA family protein [Billgrantia aerodenitrificans]|uniref:Phage receptor n=1 Tax=Billgrantia aerodenitrificans TaxID=2733483 RepID=A0ABS9ATP7_9GAMM|nr:hypothetical protein [Halomonas aerodenitrificans]MCE8025011.1 phage receptor [Halomonas aerodenitrificans]